MINWLKNLLAGDSAEARKKRKEQERAARERSKRNRERERELMRRRGIGTWETPFFLASPGQVFQNGDAATFSVRNDRYFPA
jgi:hypothetical protein